MRLACLVFVQLFVLVPSVENMQVSLFDAFVYLSCTGTLIAPTVVLSQSMQAAL